MRKTTILAAALLTTSMSAPAFADGHQVLDSIHFIIPGGAGGGWDGTARGVGEALTESGLVATASYENMSGGGGGVAILRREVERGLGVRLRHLRQVVLARHTQGSIHVDARLISQQQELQRRRITNRAGRVQRLQVLQHSEPHVVASALATVAASRQAAPVQAAAPPSLVLSVDQLPLGLPGGPAGEEIRDLSFPDVERFL